MGDYFNKKACDRLVETMVEQRRIDKGGKGDTFTDVQMIRDRATDTAKRVSKDIENKVREKESGGRVIHGGF